MKINLPIIYDRLQCENMKLKECDIYDLSLQQTRLFQKGVPPQKEYVYIVSGNDYDLYYEILKRNSLILVNPQDRIPNRNAIVIEQEIDLLSLFYRAQDIFLFFENWSQRVITSILKQKDFVSLSNEIGAVLNNPIALFDLSFCLIGTAGTIPEKEKLNREWMDILEHGLAPIESYNIPEKDMYFFARHKNEVYVPAGNPYGNTDLFVNIYVHHELFGIVAVTNLLADISLGDKAILTIVRDYYEQYFSLSFKEKSNYNVIHYYLQQLLDQKYIPFETLEYHLQKIHWKSTGVFTLGCLCQNSGEYIQNGQIEHAYSRIKKKMNDIICLVYHNNIIVIQNNDEEPISSLENEIKKLNLRCGLSFTFGDLKEIGIAYEQALASIEYGRTNNKDQVIWSFEDAYVEFVKNELGQKKDFLVHPVIKSLAQYDYLHKTEYLRLLKTYILAGQNSKKAAELLYMHRNTFLYKLEKIENILNIKVSNLNEKEREIILYSLLLI